MAEPSPLPVVSLLDDAQLLTPAGMSRRLADLTRDGSVEADHYGNGGAVAAFEARIAALLGKERAVMFPTGTLANLIAMRLLAGPAPARILVQRDSHFFNDSGDNLAVVGGYTMVPLSGSGAGYGAEAVEAEIARAEGARVSSRIGCIAVESPSRRLEGRRFAQDDITAIAALAQRHGIPMFLDGARMLIQCAFTGQSPAAMAAPFDLVYVSLYKYLDAPFGCVLAGPAALLADACHQRRRQGGGLSQMWPAAVLAAAALDRQPAEWARIIAQGDAVLHLLGQRPGLKVVRLADGTNAVRLELSHPPDAEAVACAAAGLGLKLPPLHGAALTVKMNASWLSRDAATLAGKIAEALGLAEATTRGDER